MNWPLVKLSDVCQINIGKTPSRANSCYWGKGNPWLSIRDMSQGTKISDTKEEITDIGVKESNIKIVPKGTVLFSFKLSIGKIGITQREMYTNEAIAALLIKNKSILFENYLVYALSNLKLAGTTDRAVMGATLNKEKLKEIKIPLPPLEEQKRIAAILDKADAVRRKRQQAIELSEQLLRSVFLDMFGDPVSNSKNWKSVALEDIADIRSGITKGRKLNDANVTEIPYMRVANVQDGYIRLDDVAKIAITNSELERYKLKRNDILLTEGGDPDKLGRGAVWDAEIEPCIHQNHIFSVRLKKESEYTPHYLSMLVGSSYGKKYFLRASKQTTGIATINKTQLKEFPVLSPPLELQHKFEKIFERIVSTTKQYKLLLNTQETLFNTLAQKAFSGELNELSEIELA